MELSKADKRNINEILAILHNMVVRDSVLKQEAKEQYNSLASLVGTPKLV